MCVYPDGSNSDDDSDNEEDWSDPCLLATGGGVPIRVHTHGKLFGKLWCIAPSPEAECRERALHYLTRYTITAKEMRGAHTYPPKINPDDPSLEREA